MKRYNLTLILVIGLLIAITSSMVTAWSLFGFEFGDSTNELVLDVTPEEKVALEAERFRNMSITPIQKLDEVTGTFDLLRVSTSGIGTQVVETFILSIKDKSQNELEQEAIGIVNVYLSQRALELTTHEIEVQPIKEYLTESIEVKIE